jgi:hypothetical protein
MYFGNTNWVRNVDALTGGIVALRKKEFEPYIKTYDDIDQKAVFEFSKIGITAQRYNTLYTEVILDTYSITFTPNNPNIKFFNNNLMNLGPDYIPYTPESAAINILLRIAEG